MALPISSTGVRKPYANIMNLEMGEKDDMILFPHMISSPKSIIQIFDEDDA